jgi:hypothetical protein
MIRLWRDRAGLEPGKRCHVHSRIEGEQRIELGRLREVAGFV